MTPTQPFTTPDHPCVRHLSSLPVSVENLSWVKPRTVDGSRHGRVYEGRDLLVAWTVYGSYLDQIGGSELDGFIYRPE